jgi:hypothetical protein
MSFGLNLIKNTSKIQSSTRLIWHSSMNKKRHHLAGLFILNFSEMIFAKKQALWTVCKTNSKWE